MATIQLKEVEVPLFGVVEAKSQAAWLSAFSSTGTTIDVRFDDAALDMIATELELDAEGLAADAERYVTGTYRAKARGMAGGRLGELGEVLTFLVNRARGQTIARVVSWRVGAGQAVKGSRFPQPDFLVQSANGTSALEVKSTEAFDYVGLRDTQKKWTFLRPCSSVAGCRELALSQLAFVNGTLQPQQHALLVQDGNVVPFPVGSGIATAVIAVDGRTNSLRSHPKYRTPPTCRQANRDCWTCSPTGCHVILVRMPNAPGNLVLGGQTNSSTYWLPAYQRWTQALVARDIHAVRESLGILVAQTSNWLSSPDVPDIQPRILREFWGSYLLDAMRTRGFEMAVPGRLGDLRRRGFEWAPAPLADAAIREGNFDQVSQALLTSQRSSRYSLSARVSNDPSNPATFSVTSSAELLQFRLTSSTWWTTGATVDENNAPTIANELLSLVIWLFGGVALDPSVRIPLREIVAQVGRHTWRSLHFRAPWIPLLASGDPRARMRVLRDGRADLRIHRALLGVE